jgi:hypothetical protein
MTVKELIDRLGMFEQGAEVCVADGPLSTPHPVYECCQDEDGRIVIEPRNPVQEREL